MAGDHELVAEDHAQRSGLALAEDEPDVGVLAHRAGAVGVRVVDGDRAAGVHGGGVAGRVGDHEGQRVGAVGDAAGVDRHVPAVLAQRARVPVIVGAAIAIGVGSHRGGADLHGDVVDPGVGVGRGVAEGLGAAQGPARQQRAAGGLGGRRVALLQREAKLRDPDQRPGAALPVAGLGAVAKAAVDRRLQVAAGRRVAVDRLRPPAHLLLEDLLPRGDEPEERVLVPTAKRGIQVLPGRGDVDGHMGDRHVRPRGGHRDLHARDRVVVHVGAPDAEAPTSQRAVVKPAAGPVAEQAPVDADRTGRVGLALIHRVGPGARRRTGQHGYRDGQQQRGGEHGREVSSWTASRRGHGQFPVLVLTVVMAVPGRSNRWTSSTSPTRPTSRPIRHRHRCSSSSWWVR